MKLLRFTKDADDGGGDLRGLGWHIEHNPIEGDRTFCGIAFEGLGSRLADPYETKEGRKPTCEHCLSLARFAQSLPKL